MAQRLPGGHDPCGTRLYLSFIIIIGGGGVFLDLLEAVGVDVGVDLGGGDVGVSEEFLDDAEVGAAGEEVGGEGVAEGVGVDGADAGAAGD